MLLKLLNGQLLLRNNPLELIFLLVRIPLLLSIPFQLILLLLVGLPLLPIVALQLLFLLFRILLLIVLLQLLFSAAQHTVAANVSAAPAAAQRIGPAAQRDAPAACQHAVPDV